MNSPPLHCSNLNNEMEIQKKNKKIKTNQNQPQTNTKPKLLPDKNPLHQSQGIVECYLYFKQNRTKVV